MSSLLMFAAAGPVLLPALALLSPVFAPQQQPGPLHPRPRPPRPGQIKSERLTLN